MVYHLAHLLSTRRFAPLIITQFTGAFNDNLLKNALVVLVVFGVVLDSPIDPKILVTLAAGLFIAPYVLFSAIAGQLADKYEKACQVRRIKWAELGLMLLASLGFWLESTWLLIVVLAGMGVQSAFFSPLKYSLVPDHLKKEEILGGNALLEATTFLAILSGTIAGALLIMSENGRLMVCMVLLCGAGCGLIASYRIPQAGPYMPHLALDYNIFAESGRLLRQAFAQPALAGAILGISWFWLIGANFVSQLPAFTKEVLGGDEAVTTVLLAAFSVGIAFGSFLVHGLLKGRISTRLVPLGLFGISLFSVDLYWTCQSLRPSELFSVHAFLQQAAHIRVMADLVMIAASGGLFVVPLNALLQTACLPDYRARTIAANNVMNALFMVLSSLSISLLLLWGATIPEIFLIFAILNGAVLLAFIRWSRNRS